MFKNYYKKLNFIDVLLGNELIQQWFYKLNNDFPQCKIFKEKQNIFKIKNDDITNKTIIDINPSIKITEDSTPGLNHTSITLCEAQYVHIFGKVKISDLITIYVAQGEFQGIETYEEYEGLFENKILNKILKDFLNTKHTYLPDKEFIDIYIKKRNTIKQLESKFKLSNEILMNIQNDGSITNDYGSSVEGVRDFSNIEEKEKTDFKIMNEVDDKFRIKFLNSYSTLTQKNKKDEYYILNKENKFVLKDAPLNFFVIDNCYFLFYGENIKHAFDYRKNTKFDNKPVIAPENNDDCLLHYFSRNVGTPSLIMNNRIINITSIYCLEDNNERNNFKKEIYLKMKDENILTKNQIFKNGKFQINNETNLKKNKIIIFLESIDLIMSNCLKMIELYINKNNYFLNILKDVIKQFIFICKINLKVNNQLYNINNNQFENPKDFFLKCMSLSKNLDYTRFFNAIFFGDYDDNFEELTVDPNYNHCQNFLLICYMKNGGNSINIYNDNNEDNNKYIRKLKTNQLGGKPLKRKITKLSSINQTEKETEETGKNNKSLTNLLQIGLKKALINNNNILKNDIEDINSISTNKLNDIYTKDPLITIETKNITNKEKDIIKETIFENDYEKIKYENNCLRFKNKDKMISRINIWKELKKNFIKLKYNNDFYKKLDIKYDHDKKEIIINDNFIFNNFIVLYNFQKETIKKICLIWMNPLILNKNIIDKVENSIQNDIEFENSDLKINKNIILADEMGLGKTIQTFNIILVLRVLNIKNNLKPDPFIIITPYNILLKTKDDLNQYCDNINIPHFKIELIHKREQLNTIKRKILIDNFFDNNCILLITPFILKIIYNNFIIYNKVKDLEKEESPIKRKIIEKELNKLYFDCKEDKDDYKKFIPYFIIFNNKIIIKIIIDEAHLIINNNETDFQNIFSIINCDILHISATPFKSDKNFGLVKNYLGITKLIKHENFFRNIWINVYDDIKKSFIETNTIILIDSPKVKKNVVKDIESVKKFIKNNCDIKIPYILDDIDINMKKNNGMVIYCEFPVVLDLIIELLSKIALEEEREICYFVINGNVNSLEKRDDAIDEFNEFIGFRILFITNVASVGKNIYANFMSIISATYDFHLWEQLRNRFKRINSLEISLTWRTYIVLYTNDENALYSMISKNRKALKQLDLIDINVQSLDEFENLIRNYELIKNPKFSTKYISIDYKTLLFMENLKRKFDSNENSQNKQSKL
jgi:hypothetical protein